MEGMKNDQGKLLWGLLPWKEMEEVIRVLMHGAKKYSPDNWQKISKKRYKEALLRHIILYAGGEKVDQDSNLHHLAHAICNALFIMWHEKDGKVGTTWYGMPSISTKLTSLKKEYVPEFNRPSSECMNSWEGPLPPFEKEEEHFATDV